jgi:hypothetical protein
MINNFLLDVLAAVAILLVILVITFKNLVTAAAITIIALLFVAALLFKIEYIHSIVSEFSIFSGLGILSVVPIKPFPQGICPLSSIEERGAKADGKPRRLKNEEKEKLSLATKEKEILVGLLLGDLNVQKRNKNVRLRFIQSIIHEEYLMELYTMFKKFCPQVPKILHPKPDSRTGKVYSYMFFNSYTLPCFVPLYALFYVAGKKVVPSTIGDLLTPLGLAHWICDDGTWDKRARHVRLSTHSFTLADVNLLTDALNKNFDLKCYVNKHTSGGFIIIIPSYSVPILQGLLKAIMPPMMLHKIGL